MKTYIYSIIAATFLVVSCTPQIDDKVELGDLPNPSFEISDGAGPNDFVLRNTTPETFITQWSLGDLGTANGAEVEVNVPFMGTYPITMTTFNDGGSASVTKDLEVLQDDPNACNGNIELLTDCSEKTWVLAPEAGAMNVGPSVSETWWGNSESDVTERACHFDDLYIFRSNGEFEYDNQGDFWADSDDSGNVWPADLGLAVGCHDADSWPDPYKAWSSGMHNFSVNSTNLTVSGEGAFIGLYKVGTASEVTTPQQSVSLQILEISESRMVLFADFGGVVWRFTLVTA